MKRRQFTQFAIALLTGGSAALHSVPADARKYDERHENRSRQRDSWIKSLDGERHSHHDRHDRHDRHDDEWRKRQKYRKSQRNRWQRSSGSDCSACW